MRIRSCSRDTWWHTTGHHTCAHRSSLVHLCASGTCSDRMHLLIHRHSHRLSARHTGIGRVAVDHLLTGVRHSSRTHHARLAAKRLLCHAGHHHRRPLRLRPIRPFAGLRLASPSNALSKSSARMFAEQLFLLASSRVPL